MYNYMINFACGLVYIYIMYNKKYTDNTIETNYYLTFGFAQHVSGASTPIIRSLQLH